AAAARDPRSSEGQRGQGTGDRCEQRTARAGHVWSPLHVAERDVRNRCARAPGSHPSAPWSAHGSAPGFARARRAVPGATVSTMASFDFDVLIIGSGFGGSVAALRAAEKGYRVGVMESGRRWADEDIPKTQWDIPHFLWLPAAELYGIQRIEYLDDVLI